MEFKVSIVIAVYNASKFIEKAVDSALMQPEVKEIILVEDGSEDDTLDICAQLSSESEKIKLLRHSDHGNHGAGASWNLGLKFATSSFVHILGADDFFLPNRFRVTKDVFLSNPSVDGVYEAIGCHFVSNVDKEVYISTGLPLLTTVNCDKFDGQSQKLFENLSGMSANGGYFSLDGLTLKREALFKMNSLFNEDLRLHQDTDFIIRLSYYCTLHSGSLKEPVALRTVHNANRITAVLRDKSRESRTKMLLYSSLITWAIDSNLEKRYLRKFQGSFLSFRLYTLPKVYQLWLIILNMLVRRDVFNTKNVRYGVFNTLREGKNPLVNITARFLEALCIRIVR